jgi:segregation and condensation protein A
MSYKVKLPAFEGPFDLLVYLIENAQMSIYDIQVSEITNQYMDYIDTMNGLNVNLSSEFMVLAAELIEIKSKMMLPKNDLDADLLSVEDPRSDLVERLLAYKKCRRCSEMLQECEEMMADVFEKPQEDISCYLDNPDEYLSLDIKEFARAFSLFLSKKQRIEETQKHYTLVERQRETMEKRMEYIRDTFRHAIRTGNDELNLKELIPDVKNRYDVVVTFVSVLQMMRERYLDAIQRLTYGEITVILGNRGFDEPAQEVEEIDQ